MKTMIKDILALALQLFGWQQVQAQTPTDSMAPAETDTLPADPYFGLSHYEGLVTSKIGMLARTYGDSIVLRWAAEDYV